MNPEGVRLAADCESCRVGVSGSVDMVADWLKAHAALVVAPIPIEGRFRVAELDPPGAHVIEVRRVQPVAGEPPLLTREG